MTFSVLVRKDTKPVCNVLTFLDKYKVYRAQNALHELLIPKYVSEHNKKYPLQTEFFVHTEIKLLCKLLRRKSYATCGRTKREIGVNRTNA